MFTGELQIGSTDATNHLNGSIDTFTDLNTQATADHIIFERFHWEVHAFGKLPTIWGPTRSSPEKKVVRLLAQVASEKSSESKSHSSHKNSLETGEKAEPPAQTGTPPRCPSEGS